MNRYLFLAALSLGVAAPAFAQHEGHGAPQTPAPQTPEPQRPAPQQPPAAPAEQHGQHDQDDKPAVAMPDQHAGHDMADEAVDPPEVGNDIPPDAPNEFAADRVFPQGDMNRARGILRDEHGGALTYKIMGNLLEYQSQNGQDGYRWEGEAWFGGDLDRLVIKTEGEGSKDIGDAEVQALYSRAVGPYTDIQVGIRHDVEPNPSRTYLAFGVESLLPYWFKANAGLFVGERGQVLGRLEGSYDFSADATSRAAAARRAQSRRQERCRRLVSARACLTPRSVYGCATRS
jgi:copper resistance protein B